MSGAPAVLSAPPAALPRVEVPRLPPGTPPASSVLGALREHREVALLIFLILALAALGFALVLYLRKRRSAATVLGGSLDRQRLVRVEQAFRRQLPRSVREALPDCGQFLVFGTAGVGKSTLIARHTDWQAQASQFLPSYTADPLLQIYLSRQLVVHELSAALLLASTGEASAALRALFQDLLSGPPPVAIIVVSFASLREATPDRLRQQAQLVRGKLNLLAEAIGTAVLTRICVTGMDRVPGYPALARMLHGNQIEYGVDLGVRARHPVTNALEGCVRHLPRALTSLPVASFDAITTLLADAPQLLQPLAQYVDELTEPSLAGVRPDLERLYFFSPAAEEQLGSPFAVPKPMPRSLPRASRLRRLLSLDGRVRAPAHALAALLVVICGGGLLTWVVRRHGSAVDSARASVLSLNQRVTRMQAAGSSGEPSSDALLQRAQLAARQLQDLSSAEARFRPLSLLYRHDKTELRAALTESLRRAYLLPLLQTAVRQRSREKILYALAALYATPTGSLGSLLRAQAADFQSQIGLPVSIAEDYLRFQDGPYSEAALVTLPALEDGSAPPERLATESPKAWLVFLEGIRSALSKSTISAAEVESLRSQTQPLKRALARTEQDAQERQIYRLLSEEAPLDMARLFGASAHALNPAPFLADNRGSLNGLLSLIDESARTFGRNDRMSLYRLLKWLNELGNRPAASGEQYHVVIDDRVFHFTKQQWLDLLFRSRQRTLGSVARLGAPAALTSAQKPCRGKRCGADRCQPSRRSPGRHSRSAADSRSARCQKPAALQRQAPDAFTRDEVLPQVARLYTSDTPPPAGISEIYNRALLSKEILPLVQELRKALSDSASLSPDEKLGVARLVQDEIRTYARRYCIALRNAYDAFDGFPSPSRSLTELRTALLTWPGADSPFIEHLRTIADNADLDGLREPYLRPLAECLAPFRPLAAIVEPGKDGGYPGLLPYKNALASLAADLAGESSAANAPTPSDGSAQPASATGSPGQPAAKGPAAAPPPTAAPEPALFAHLSPAARTAVRLRTAGTSRHAIDQFLDSAGLAGALRRPFLRPLTAVYQHGLAELEAAMSRHTKEELAPALQRIMTAFPFSRSSKIELDPPALQALSPVDGAVLDALRGNYIGPGFVTETNGEYTAAKRGADSELQPPRLPKELLSILNQAFRLSRLLFRADGSRQPLRFQVRALAVPAGSGSRSSQPTLTFLSIGKSQVFGFNQQESSKPLEFEWWSRSAAAVGVEYTPADSNRKETRSLEIAEANWSLYRLLQRAPIVDETTVFWQLARESETSRWSLGFAFEPDPWSLLAPTRATVGGTR